MNGNRMLQIGVLCLVSYFSLFSNAGTLNLDVMEARNIVTAREMVQFGNWLIPTMNGEVRIAKPPLPTWLASLALQWSGTDEDLWRFRIPSGLAALLMVFFVFGISSRLTRNALIPFLSAAVLATTVLLMVMARRASWDIFCHAFMAGAIWAFFRGWEKDSGRWGAFISAGFWMGLSFMSKGPIAFHSMLLPFIVGYCVSYGHRPITRKWKGLLVAFAICGLISFPWYIYVYFNLPAAAVSTASTEVLSWFPSHGKSLFYYFQFPVQSGIWTFFTLFTLIIPYARKRIDSFGKNYTFLLTWLVLTVLLLTGVAKKSTHYLLPVVVPMSLLIGFYIGYLVEAFQKRRQTMADSLVVTFHSVFVIIVALGVPGLLYYFGFKNQTLSLYPFIGYSILFAGLGILLIQAFLRKGVQRLFWLSVALLSLGCWVVPPIAVQAAHQRNFMVLKEVRQIKEIEGMPWYSTYAMNPKEIWAVGRRVAVLDHSQLDALTSGTLPAAIFSKEHPDLFREKDPWNSFSIRLVDELSDKRTKESWYLFIVDKK